MAIQQGNDGLRELALFAGAGGGILGGHLLGWRTVCAVERDAYAAQVLAQRQNDGCLPPFPVWSDVENFNGEPWRGRVDVVSGGFPCQDISSAGRGAGIEGGRSGLWSEFARIIGEVRPRFVYVENSPVLTSRGLGRVLGDLAAMGYDAEWGVLGADDTGAPHRRKRIWVVANANSWNAERRQGERPWIYGEKGGERSDNNLGRPSTPRKTMADPDSLRKLQPEGRKQDERRRASNGGKDLAYPSSLNAQREQPSNTNQEDGRIKGKRQARPCGDGLGRWPTEPDVGRVANGVAYRVDRLKAIGNGQVPRVAATAWEVLTRRII